MLRKLLSLRAVLNGSFAFYLLLWPVLSRIDGFMHIIYYALADGLLALLVAGALHRSVSSPAAYVWAMSDAVVRLTFGVLGVTVPAIGVLMLTPALFAALAAKVALLLGLGGIACIAWTILRGERSEAPWVRFMVLLMSTSMVLFALAVATNVNFGMHGQQVVGVYALIFAIVLAFAARQARITRGGEQTTASSENR